MGEPCNHSVSFETPVSGDTEGITVGDTIADPCNDIEALEENLYKSQLAKSVRRAVSKLPERRRKAIEAYYFDGLTYSDIGVELNISASSAGQTVKSGLQDLRKGEDAERLAAFLNLTIDPYGHTSNGAWKRSGCSVEEYIVIRRETISEKLSTGRNKRIDYCMNVLGWSRDQAEKLFPA